MSCNNLNIPTSAKQIRRTRGRRSGASSNNQKPRERALWELIELANFLLENGSLSSFDRSAENYEDMISFELGIKLQIKQKAAKKLMKLRELIFNNTAWSFLKETSYLGVFADFHFTKPYGTIKNDGGSLSLDIFEAFLNGKDTTKHDDDIRNQTRARKLDVIALSYSHEARDFIVTMFLKTVATISTLCSFIPETRDISWSQIMDIIGRYTTSSWHSDAKQKEYHNDVNAMHLVDGWHIVSEVYKIQVQELFLQKSCSDQPPASSSMVQLQDVRASVCEFTKHVVCEFLAWCVVCLGQNQKREQSAEALLDTLDDLYEKLSESIGVKPAEEDIIGENFIRNLIDGVAKNQPTMAEVKYECKEMTPCRRETRINFSKRTIIWRTCDIFLRCRWQGSSAAQTYKNFLERAKREEDKKIELEQQKAEQNSTDPVSEDINMTDMLEPGEKIKNISSKRNAREMNEYEEAMKIREEDRKKRMTALRNAASKRLTRALRDDRVARGEQLKNRYCDDGDSSDEEKAVGGCDVGVSEEEKNVTQEVNLVMQLLYELILDWPVFPTKPARMQITAADNLAEFNVPLSKHARADVSDLLTGDDTFVSIQSEMKYKNFFSDITKARSIARYAEHWRHTLPFEIRGMVSDAISQLLPTVKADPRKPDEWAQDIDNDRYLNLFVEKSSPEKGLLNITCRSTNPLLAKRIVTELQGGTLCAGYVRGLRVDQEPNQVRGNSWRTMKSNQKKVEKFSTLVLIACRRVHWDNDDKFEMVSEKGLDEVIVHLAVSRQRMKHINGIWENDTIRLVYLCPLTPHLRMFKSVQEASLLPDEAHRVLCGPPEERPIVPPLDELTANIDKGCYEYLINVRNTTNLIDNSQMQALLTVLGNIGAAKYGSASVSLIQGPPGTGKTKLLNIIIGALLHHSTNGHLKGEQINMLKKELGCDGILRRSRNPDALGILVCAGSNQAVDNVLRRMDEEQGIPDGKGRNILPQAVRLARQGYDYGALKKYSINDKALPFDFHIHNRNQPARINASSAARRSFSKEVIVGFTTCSTSGGARIKNLKGRWDIVIVDEAGQINEPESMIPIVNAYKRNNSRRSHTILFGDQKQLDPVVSAMWMMKRNHKILPFSYPMQMKSLFERLQRTKRCPSRMLMTQYRSHPCIAKLVSSTFYEGAVESVKPASHFADAYNAGCSSHAIGYAPVTLIDTSKLSSRFEHNDQNGSVDNMLEVDVIKDILEDIRNLAGTSFELLRKQIAILAPYRAQVKMIRDVLERYHLYHNKPGPTRRGYEILVDTVDSMQGDERDVVILFATRSNNDQSIGFVDSPNRLNVAISRARKLLIIVADMSTLSVSTEFNSVWKYAAHGCNNAALLIQQMGRPGDETRFSQRFLHRKEEISGYLSQTRKAGGV